MCKLLRQNAEGETFRDGSCFRPATTISDFFRAPPACSA
jgi:hypothetical protein